MTVPRRIAPRVVPVAGYDVVIGAGLRHEYAAHIVAAAPAHWYAVISDAGAAPHYVEFLGTALAQHGRVALLEVPSGETHKSRESWARLTDAMIARGCGRDTTVVALGGGVVGDLAGFVAATYMRGVPVVQCATSLLAMIDASVGGKTGVDTPLGKNLVGAFHPPAIVLLDVETLATLPLAQRRSGLAEAIKHGVIADAVYFDRIERELPLLLDVDPGATLDLVTRSVEIKSAVVRADPSEHGLRRTLNYGHTIGHAVEHASGYSLLHGEAVAIGMVLEARLAERIGVAASGTEERISAVLRRAGLPVVLPETLSADVVLAATRRDKKSRAGRVVYALPTKIGAMATADGSWAMEVSERVVREVLS